MIIVPADVLLGERGTVPRCRRCPRILWDETEKAERRCRVCRRNDEHDASYERSIPLVYLVRARRDQPDKTDDELITAWRVYRADNPELSNDAATLAWLESRPDHDDKDRMWLDKLRARLEDYPRGNEA